MLPHLNNVCLALALIPSKRAGVVTHPMTCGYATIPPTLLVVQQEDQEGSCVIDRSIYLAILFTKRGIRVLRSVSLASSHCVVFFLSYLHMQRYRRLPIVPPTANKLELG